MEQVKRIRINRRLIKPLVFYEDIPGTGGTIFYIPVEPFFVKDSTRTLKITPKNIIFTR